MNEQFNVCYFCWAGCTLKKQNKKKLDFDAFGMPYQPTNRPTDTAYHRDARTHLKQSDTEDT